MCHDAHRSLAPDRGDLTRHVQVPASGGGAIPGVLQRAVGRRCLAPVLLITDIYGPIAFYRGLAGLLAEAGHDTLVVDYLHRAGPLERTEREPALARASRLDQHRAVADLSAACAWLREDLPAQLAGPADHLAAPARIGVLGFCLGGSLACNLATVEDDLALVSFYGFPAGVPGEHPAPAPLELVAQLDAPMLAFWGAEDYMDMDAVRRFVQRMSALHDEFDAEIYPKAGHSFLGGLIEDKHAARDAWRRTLAFFAHQLREPAGARR